MTLKEVLELWAEYKRDKEEKYGHLRFGQIVVSKLGWHAPEIFYEPDDDKALKAVIIKMTEGSPIDWIAETYKKGGRKMKNERARVRIAELQDLILVSCEPPDGINEALDYILEAVAAARGGFAKAAAQHAIVAAMHWATGKQPCKKHAHTNTLMLDPRTRLYMALEWIDELLMEAGYPSWQQLRDEWSDAVEGG